MNFKLIIPLTGLLIYTSCDTAKEASTPLKVDQPKTKHDVKTTIDVSYIDNSVKPQDDFFLYANGSWIKNNPVPASESRWGSFNELDKANNDKLTKILEEVSLYDNKKGSVNQLLAAYYQSYTDMNTRNDMGISPIQSELDLISGIISKEQLPSVLAKLHADGVPGFFSFGVGQDLKDVDHHITYLSQGGLGLPNRDYYTKEDKQELREKYQMHIQNILAQITNSEMKQGSVEDIMSIESQLAAGMMTPAELRIPENTYNKLPKSFLKENTKNFDWETYFEQVGSQSFDSLVIGQPSYITRMDSLIGAFELEPLKNYLTWKLINNYAGHLNEELANEHFAFYGKELSGTKEMKPITERAIKEITGSTLGDQLGRAFVERHYSDEAQRKINKLVDDLLAVFRERIQNLEWMSSETKAEAENKLNSIGRKLGFPSKWEDLSKLDLSKGDYIGNIKAIAAYDHKKNMAKLGENVDKEEWGMPAHMVNAYYHPLLNEIAFPAGIMQPPFFSENYEDAVNYGRIGMVIGHEFTHGFDDMGSKFAADGSFKNWWTEEDRSLFEDRTKILGNTFANFCPIDDQCVNPELTMGENIADLGGLTLAYYAYARTEEFKSATIVDGFTPAQRFFLAYAQLWKINYTEAELKKRLATDPHSPGMYRVNGPLKNCPEFFGAFNVVEGDPMRNPEQKVARIW